MKLLSSTASPYARKVRIVLAEKKIECELQPVDVFPVDNPVNAHNPLGKIPTLVLDDGTVLYDSMRDTKERSRDWSDKQLARMRRGCTQMSKEIEGRAWCHGGRYSLADIALGCCLGWLGFRQPGDTDWHAEYPGLARQYHKLMERPAFADTVPQASRQ